jgi:hypothetical protein
MVTKAYAADSGILEFAFIHRVRDYVSYYEQSAAELESRITGDTRTSPSGLILTSTISRLGVQDNPRRRRCKG